jgi:hypothetical protein
MISLAKAISSSQESSNSYVEFHKNVLSILWSIVINIAVFIAIFKFKNISFWLHVLMTSIVIVLTLVAVTILNFVKDSENKE